MIRKVKVMGLALVAVFAMTAVAASAASAAEAHFKWPSGTTKLTASQAATSGEQVFTTKFGTVKCQEVSGSATVTGTEATTVTGENIRYNDTGKTTCRAPFGTTATIEMNGCHYQFNAGTLVTGKEESNGSVTLKGCNATGHITINATGCVITVAQEQILSPVTYRASGGVVTIVPSVSNITYSASGILCSGSGLTGGTYTGNVTVTGNNGGGLKIG